ncbi:hypothetical protein FHS20_004233 [Phyllobacterium endophyticum]|nr:hypothetical protein [Phyllobacterium endophyticum]
MAETGGYRADLADSVCIIADDLAADGPAHEGQHSTGYVEEAEHIGAIDSLYFGYRRLPDSAHQSETRIVERDIDTPEAIDRGFRRCGRLFVAGDISATGSRLGCSPNSSTDARIV